MQTLDIRQFEARYRLPRSTVWERERLDQVLVVVLEEALEQALAEVGVADSADVCIQALYVPVHLRLSGTEAALARAWSRALAEAIGRAARGGHVSGVVYYPSRVHALIDFAAGIAQDNLGRAWAWGQLGLCRATGRLSDREAVGELVRALVEEPSAVVPVLVALADGRLLGRLARRLSVGQWGALAGAALGQSGSLDLPALAGSVASRVSAWDALEPTTGPERLVAPTVLRAARQLIARSRLAAALADFLAGPAELGRALAALVVLEADPAVLSAPAETVRTLLAVVADQVRSAPLVRPGETTLAEQEEDGVAPPHALTSYSGDLESGEIPEPTWVISAEQGPLPAARQRALTRCGGLLFLCGVVADLSLPEEMAQQVAGTGRSVRWFLQRLALQLVPAEPADPAVLAFGGLPPGSEPPSADAEPPTAAEETLLEGFAARVLARLRTRLDRPEQPAPELIRFVCMRRAEVVADPGWVEVRFALEEVSTEIRRAGLDLDPGYLPWLGVVLKFVYV
jgi:hypothetical protein